MFLLQIRYVDMIHQYLMGSTDRGASKGHSCHSYDGLFHGQNKDAAESPGCCQQPEPGAVASLLISKAVGPVKAGLVRAGCGCHKTVSALQILLCLFGFMQNSSALSCLLLTRGMSHCPG